MVVVEAQVVRHADPTIAVPRADPELVIESLFDAAVSIGAGARVVSAHGQPDEVHVRYVGTDRFVQVQ